jgi:hypothetical protein
MVDFTFQGSDTGVARWQEALKVGRTLSPTFQARTAQSLHCAASKPSPSIGLSFAKFTYRVTAARPRAIKRLRPTFAVARLVHCPAATLVSQSRVGFHRSAFLPATS